MQVHQHQRSYESWMTGLQYEAPQVCPTACGKWKPACYDDPDHRNLMERSPGVNRNLDVRSD